MQSTNATRASYSVRHTARPSGGHLDVPAGVEAVELRHDLQHRALHLDVRVVVVAGRPEKRQQEMRMRMKMRGSCLAQPVRDAAVPGSSDRVHLVEEDDAGLLGPRQGEQLSHHART